MQAAGALLIVAYESTKQFHDRGELWEFLRHCRNAAAHNGRFHFRRNEPRYEAKWSSLDVTKPLQGTPLFPQRHQPGAARPRRRDQAALGHRARRIPR